MTKREIAKLPQEEQDFIYSYGLQKQSLETIRSIQKNYDYLVYQGLI